MKNLRKGSLEYIKGKLPGADDLSVDGVQCGGCLSDNVFGFCKECSIRDCTKTKGYSGCHECDDFPCQYIEEFPMPVGKKVILRAIPYWREHGTEKFVRDEEARYCLSWMWPQVVQGRETL